MKERMSPILSPEGRVEFLFGQIQKKVTAEDAYAALERYQVSLSEKKKRERGERSEMIVMHALTELPNIEAIIRSAPFSIEDKKGIDLTVILVQEPISRVGVQVKSNDEAVREFRDFTSRSGEYRPDGDDILARRGLIILNARTSTVEIQENFLSGLGRVIHAAQAKGEVA